MTATKLAQAKTANEELPPMPSWKSKIVIGSFVAIAVMVANYFGVLSDITGVEQEAATDLIVLIIGGGGSLAAIISRLRQKAAPPIKVL